MHPASYGAQNIHHQQLIMDDDCSSHAFSVSDPQNPLFQPHLQFSSPSQGQKEPQQLIFFQHHQQHHQFQALHQQFQQGSERLHRQLRLGHEHEPAPMQHPFFNVNFKLGLNEHSADEERGLNRQQDATFLHGNAPHSAVLMPNFWHPHEDSAIYKSFRKPLGRCDERCSEDGEQNVEEKRYNTPLQQQANNCTTEMSLNSDGKCRAFGELAAIYSLAKIGHEANQAGSGSALTGENSPANAALSMPFGSVQGHCAAVNTGAANTVIGVDHGSETSIGEEGSLSNVQKKKRKRKMKKQFGSMGRFFESLVKQVMDHQEVLNRKFLEVIERMDKERTQKEEAWRRQEAAKHNREAIARAHEQALASSREALIVSCLEKITGQSVNLPARTPLLLQQEGAIEPSEKFTSMEADCNGRWPTAEVQALIQVRSSLESKFQEPGLKGPLWEEVSSFLASMGYRRSAKRCKEKWENINKYFRKSKESGKKRSQQSKTCSYFDQLDQLYARSLNSPPPPSSSIYSGDIKVQRPDSEFLEAFNSERNLEIRQLNSSGSLKGSDMGYPKLDFDGITDQNVEHQGSDGEEKESNEGSMENNDEADYNDGETGTSYKGSFHHSRGPKVALL